MTRSGDEYVRGLRDARTVLFNGARVADVTTHSAFAAGVRTVARRLLTSSRDVVKGFVQALCEAIALARRDRAAAKRIYARYLKVHDPETLSFMYRTYVEGAIPQRPFPRLENVALGVEEFASKPGLKGKRAEELTDLTLVTELEKEGLFIRLYRTRSEHAERAQ